MAPKKQQQDAGGKKEPAKSSDPKEKAVSDEEVRQESSKAANASMNAQKKAKDLKAAAAGAGDPDERQKLTEQAINAQVEAESFGKTAKYLQSGAFQGMAVGTGLGVAPGATLGAVTGTLVGGVTSTITGGLGGGIGTAAGAIGGPMWNLGDLAGKGVRKFTGDLPGWVASDEQKQSLEKMMGQIQEEDMPDENELKKLHEEGGSATADEGWMSSVKNMVPSMGGGEKSATSDGQKQDPKDSDKLQAKDVAQKEKSAASATNEDSNAGSRKKPRKLETKSKDSEPATEEPTSDRKKPKKLEKRSGGAAAESSKDQDSQLTEAKAEAERRENILKKMLQDRGVSDEEIESRLHSDGAFKD